MYIFRNRGLLMAPANDGGDPGSGGGSGDPPPTGDPAPVADPPAPTGDPAPPGDGDPITMTGPQMAERLARDRAAQLQRMGFESEEQLIAMRDRDAASTEAAEVARRATLSREQALQEDVTARTGERDAFELERDELRFQAHVSGICATVGVRNLSYASHLVQQAAEACAEGEQLDVEAFLRERIDPTNETHEASRAALGMESVPVVTQELPVTTTDPTAPPTPPTPGGPPPAATDAMSMDPAAWAERQAVLGIG